MSPRTSWRVRLPDLAALLDDPRVHAVLIEPQGLPDVRDAAGERLDLWLPPLGASLARALARRPETLDDDAFIFSSVPCATGVALHVRRRAGQDQLGLPTEIAHVVSRYLALGASVLVTAPTVAARALGVGMVARAAAAAGVRLLALPEARERHALTIETAALEALSLDHVMLVAGELASGASRVLAVRVPCVASVPGLDIEAGVARVLACLALDVPSIPRAVAAAWVARRFELIIELDAHRIVSLAELNPGSDGAHTIQRVARRGSDGALEVELGGSRVEYLLGGNQPRPKLSAPTLSSTTVARPPTKAEVEPTQPARVAEHAPRASEHARGSELMRGPVIVRANGARTYPTRRSDPPPAPRPPTAGLPPSSRLTPLVDPPTLGANSHRAAVSGPSGLGAAVSEATADLATASAPRMGRIGRHELAELTADQLVSQSFIVDVGDRAPMPELDGLEDEASAAGVLAFDEHTASGAERAPLERLSTEVADAATGGSLVASLPQLVIGGGGGDETMQIPATLLRPPSVQLAEIASEPPPSLDAPDDEGPVAPAPLDEDDRAGRTAMGALTHDDDAPPSRPPTSGRPRVRRAKP